MALKTWPADLPQTPQRRGNALNEPFLEPIREEMEAGNVRMENRFTVTVSQVSYLYVLTDEQFARFEQFVIHDLYRGTLHFRGRCWTTEGRMGVREMYFTRGNSYKATKQTDSAFWDVSCDLSILNR